MEWAITKGGDVASSLGRTLVTRQHVGSVFIPAWHWLGSEDFPCGRVRLGRLGMCSLELSFCPLLSDL